MSAPPRTTLPAGPLSGIILADFSHVLAAPYATMLVGDLGADVSKVERPGTGDDTRTWGPPFAGDQATYFLSVNRNKRSLIADLSDPAARADLPELVRRAEPVNDLRGAFQLAEDLGLQARVTAGDGTDAIDLIANPIGLSDTPPACWRRPPRLGEHADELRAWLNDKLPDPDTDPPSLHPHRSTA